MDQPVRCQVGECPLWHPELGLLLFLDVPAGVVHAFSPASGEFREFSRGPVTGGITLQDDGNLLLFQDHRISALDINGGQHVCREGLFPESERFNDVIADPEGRVFAGIVAGDRGWLCRVDRDGSVSQLPGEFGCPNGMGFTPDLKAMYFTDSIQRKIFKFEYERASGELTQMKIFAEIPSGLGIPDGLAVDEAGYVWTAIWFGACLRRYRPDGTLDREIPLPFSQPTSLAFGGPGLGELYVTSAASDGADQLKPSQFDPARMPRGGGLYRVDACGSKGRPAFRSRIRSWRI